MLGPSAAIHTNQNSMIIIYNTLALITKCLLTDVLMLVVVIPSLKA